MALINCYRYTNIILGCCLILVISCTKNNNYAKLEPERKNFIPANSVEYDSIPEIYNQWWKEMADCAGIKNRNLQLIKWFSVPSTTATGSFKCLDIFCFGWWRVYHEIYIVSGRELDEILIKHEMLHELLLYRNLFTKDYKHHPLFKKCKVE